MKKILTIMAGFSILLTSTTLLVSCYQGPIGFHPFGTVDLSGELPPILSFKVKFEYLSENIILDYIADYVFLLEEDMIGITVKPNSIKKDDSRPPNGAKATIMVASGHEKLNEEIFDILIECSAK